MESLHKWQILRGKSSHEITLSNNQYLRTAWRLGLGDSSMEQDVFLAWITEIMKLFWTLPLIFCFTSSKTLTILVFLLWCFSLTCYFNISFRLVTSPTGHQSCQALEITVIQIIAIMNRNRSHTPVPRGILSPAPSTAPSTAIALIVEMNTQNPNLAALLTAHQWKSHFPASQSPGIYKSLF